jgi:tetratricopeptide (TPR) repeat protein
MTMRIIQGVSWPALPYKGLSYYGPSDVPLFAGREDDVQQCAKLLGLNSTRILIMHGATGCGKSSFLRAGLIPYVERVGFEFQRESEGVNDKTIFVRSTDNPLGKLAESVYDFCTRTYQIETVFGLEELKLCGLLPYPSRTEFLEKVGSNAEEMVQLLSELAARWPRTLVLVIDQAEEVLTVDMSPEGERYRKQLFEFMSLFSKKKFDLKLLVALRTEFYGRFFDRVRQVAADTVNIRDYLLTELSEEQIVSAIERPTLKTNFGNWGRPYDFYHFAFEPGVASTIANELKITALAGGELPVMQIVCENLYQTTKLKAEAREESRWTINFDDYRDLGGIEGQMDGHLRRVLEALCKENQIGELKAIKEIDCWKEVLSKLVKTQVDGTVTTDLSRADGLQQLAEQAGCVIPFEVGASYLSSDDRRILRQVDIIDMRTKTPIRCFSLGHDVIGLVLRRWQLTRDSKGAEERLRFWLDRAKPVTPEVSAPTLFSRFRSLFSQPIPVSESLRLWSVADRGGRRILRRNILVFCSRLLATVMVLFLLVVVATRIQSKLQRRESVQLAEVNRNAAATLDGAIKDSQDPTSKDANAKQAIATWAKALVKIGKFEEAKAALTKLKPDPTPQNLAYSSYPSNETYGTTDVYADVAEALEQSQRKDDANQVWRQAIDLATRKAGVSRNDALQDFFLNRLVIRLIKNGRYKEVQDVLQKLDYKGYRFSNYIALAQWRSRQGEPEAEQDWNEVIKLIDDNKDKLEGSFGYKIYLAGALAQADRVDRARSLLDKIKVNKSRDPYSDRWIEDSKNSALASIARGLTRAKRFTEALQTAREINTSAYQVDALAYLALKLSKEGKKDEAKDAWTEAKKKIDDLHTESYGSNNYPSLRDYQTACANLARRAAQADNVDDAKSFFDLALQGGKITASSDGRGALSADLTPVLLEVVRVLAVSGRENESHDLVIKCDDPKIRRRALTSLNDALTRSNHLYTALAFARQEDGMMKVNALADIARVLTETKHLTDAKSVLDEALTSAIAFGTNKSAAMSTIGEGYACSQLYYDARIAAESCNYSDRLAVYAAILATSELTKRGSLEELKPFCTMRTQPPWQMPSADD